MAERSYRLRRTGALVALLVGIVALAGLVVVVVRPARIIGAQEEALARSLARKVEAPSPGVCVENESLWRCTLSPTGRGEDHRYVVEVDDWGCWDAERSFPSASKDASQSGCIWLDDYFGLFD